MGTFTRTITALLVGVVALTLEVAIMAALGAVGPAELTLALALAAAACALWLRRARPRARR